MVKEKRDVSEIAVFGGGCFWCTEAVFKMLRGVSSVLPGYAGGTTKNPTYEEVSGGGTGHAEVVRITYNPQLTTYKDLLTVFFGSHDPTTQNRQGNDVGTQYRSVIFYTTPEQKKTAEDFIKEINISNKHGASVVTELVPLDVFYEAENYHRDYFAAHPGNPYCEVVINPKLEKVQKQFVELLETKAD
ncbi:MAG: peptide-methionine (S)-S-oxide reductase MsrA [Candidatus Taylorbacteria bacterium]|nr:peptide-methionine (S)-S-oxide reductase MsrA [Candidatus Taylorbacteria bacterium]